MSNQFNVFGSVLTLLKKQRSTDFLLNNSVCHAKSKFKPYFKLDMSVPNFYIPLILIGADKDVFPVSQANALIVQL